MKLFKNREVDHEEIVDSDKYKYNCMEGVPIDSVGADIGDSDDMYDEDDEDYDDSFFDEEPESHPIRFTLIVLTLLIASFGCLYYCYTQYMSKFGTYEGSIDNSNINKAYLEIAQSLYSDSDNSMVTPLGIDMAVTQHALDSGVSKTQQRVLVNQFNRGYQSFTVSNEYLDEYASVEDVHVLDISDSINEEISSIIDDEYTLDSDMLDADKVVVYKVPTDFKTKTSKTLTELFITGNYFKSDAAFRIVLADSTHEIIFYRDDFPTDDWERINGVLSIPLDSYTFTSSMNHTIRGLDDEELNTKIVQVLKFTLNSDIYVEESPDYNHRVGTPYNVAIRNMDTGIIIANGRISGSVGE